jgi:hypothetical protein
MPEDRKLSAADAAKLLGMSRASLHLKRKAGRITPIETDSALELPPVWYWESDVLRLRAELLADRQVKHASRQPASASA